MMMMMMMIVPIQPVLWRRAKELLRFPENQIMEQ
jgi:hypothetical protein